ncbi:MAG: glycosyltransferase family 39 protein [Deltaproteobacteria bacterium]
MTPADAIAPRLRSALAWLAAIVALTAAWRFHAIGVRSLWIDEASSVALAQMPRRAFWHALWAYEANGSAYFVLLSWWVRLGDSEIVVRSLSALLGVATIPAVYLLGVRLFDRQTALVASALLGVHLGAHWHSQEARGFALVVLILTLATDAFARIAQGTNRPRDRVAYVLWSALAVYGHLYAVLVITSHWLSLDRAQWRRLGLSTVAPIAAALCVSLWPAAWYTAFHNRGQLRWIAPTTAGEVLGAIALMVGGNLALLCALCAGLVLAVRAGTSAGARDAWALRLLALCVTGPLVAAWVLSMARPIFFFKYFIVTVPFVVLLAATALSPAGGAGAFGRLRLVALTAVLGTAVALGVAYEHHLTTYGDDWRSATAYVLSRAAPGDAIVFHISAGKNTYAYYRDHNGGAAASSPRPDVVFPASDDLASADIVPTRDRLERATVARRRVWLVLHHAVTPADEGVRAILSRGFQRVGERTFAGIHPMLSITVVLFESP